MTPRLAGMGVFRRSRFWISIGVAMAIGLGVACTLGARRHFCEVKSLGDRVKELERQGAGVWPEDVLSELGVSVQAKSVADFDGLLARIEDLGSGHEPLSTRSMLDEAVNALSRYKQGDLEMPLRADVEAAIAFPLNGTAEQWTMTVLNGKGYMNRAKRAAKTLADRIEVGEGHEDYLRGLDVLVRYVDGAPATSYLSYVCGMGVHSERDRAYLKVARQGGLSGSMARPWLVERGDRIFKECAAAIRVERCLAGGRMVRETMAMEFPEYLLCRSSLTAADADVYLMLMHAQEESVRLNRPTMSMSEFGGRMRGAGRILGAVGWWASPNLIGQLRGLRMRERLVKVAARSLLLRAIKGRMPEDHMELRKWLGENAGILDGDEVMPNIRYEFMDGEFRISTMEAGERRAPGSQGRAVRGIVESLDIRDNEVIVVLE